MLRRHIVLLIVISLSDGDVKPGGPLGAFWEEQAISRHRVSPSPFLSSSSHTTQLHYTNSYTYSHPNLNILQYTTHPICNVVCPSGAWIENRSHVTSSIHLGMEPKARNSAVGWHWKQTNNFCEFLFIFSPSSFPYWHLNHLDHCDMLTD